MSNKNPKLDPLNKHAVETFAPDKTIFSIDPTTLVVEAVSPSWPEDEKAAKAESNSSGTKAAYRAKTQDDSNKKKKTANGGGKKVNYRYNVRRPTDPRTMSLEAMLPFTVAYFCNLQGGNWEGMPDGQNINPKMLKDIGSATLSVTVTNEVAHRDFVSANGTSTIGDAQYIWLDRVQYHVQLKRIQDGALSSAERIREEMRKNAESVLAGRLHQLEELRGVISKAGKAAIDEHEANITKIRHDLKNIHIPDEEVLKRMMDEGKEISSQVKNNPDPQRCPNRAICSFERPAFRRFALGQTTPYMPRFRLKKDKWPELHKWEKEKNGGKWATTEDVKAMGLLEEAVELKKAYDAGWEYQEIKVIQMANGKPLPWWRLARLTGCLLAPVITIEPVRERKFGEQLYNAMKWVATDTVFFGGPRPDIGSSSGSTAAIPHQATRTGFNFTPNPPGAVAVSDEDPELLLRSEWSIDHSTDIKVANSMDLPPAVPMVVMTSVDDEATRSGFEEPSSSKKRPREEVSQEASSKKKAKRG